MLQAIFTSARTPRQDGYQIVAQSDDVDDAIAAELRRWAPAHDSLWTRESLNFHRLDATSREERFAISHTSLQGQDYSGRGVGRVYTHFLCVTEKELGQFACDPFRLWTAAASQDLFDEPLMQNEFDQAEPISLPIVRLLGRAAEVDENLLAEQVLRHGTDQIAAYANALKGCRETQTSPIEIVAENDGARLVAAIINSLPVAERSDVSFSTGLQASERRPFCLRVVPQIAACRV